MTPAIRWITGPAAARRAVLPARLPTGCGVVYAVLFSNGMVKVGRSANPRARLDHLAGEVWLHHRAALCRIGITSPRADAEALERAVLRRLGRPLRGNEWFSADAFAAMPRILAAALVRAG